MFLAVVQRGFAKSLLFRIQTSRCSASVLLPKMPSLTIGETGFSGGSLFVRRARLTAR